MVKMKMLIKKQKRKNIKSAGVRMSPMKCKVKTLSTPKRKAVSRVCAAIKLLFLYDIRRLRRHHYHFLSNHWTALRRRSLTDVCMVEVLPLNEGMELKRLRRLRSGMGATGSSSS